MAEANIPEDIQAGSSRISGPANIRQAKEYSRQIEKIFNDFKGWLKEDKNDALALIIHTLKEHMVKSFPQISDVDTDAILQCI